MRVKLKDVAERAGVAANTASTILNRRSNSWASKETEKRVFEAAEQLGYKPNRVARALSTGKYNTIGLIIPDLQNPFFTALAEGLELGLREKGYDLIIETTHSSVRSEQKALENIYDRQIDGLVCALIDNEAHAKTLQENFQSGRPIVALKEAIGGQSLPVHTVETDLALGLKEAINYLLAHGHEQFIFLQAKTEKQSTGLRHMVFESHLKACGIPDSGIDFACCDHTLTRSRATFAQLIKEKKINEGSRLAAIASNDLSAIGIIRACMEAGVRVPGNVSVVGIDNTKIGEYLPISLSSIAQPMEHIISNVVNLLLHSIPGDAPKADNGSRTPQQIILPSWFIPRESTAS